jgi:hypothetical protein
MTRDNPRGSRREVGSLAAAVRWYLAHDPSQLPHMFRVLWPLWSLWGHLAKARAWVDQLAPTAGSLDRTELRPPEWCTDRAR